jgi:hypothetical protein
MHEDSVKIMITKEYLSVLASLWQEKEKISVLRIFLTIFTII